MNAKELDLLDRLCSATVAGRIEWVPLANVVDWEPEPEASDAFACLTLSAHLVIERRGLQIIKRSGGDPVVWLHTPPGHWNHLRTLYCLAAHYVVDEPRVIDRLLAELHGS